MDKAKIIALVVGIVVILGSAVFGVDIKSMVCEDAPVAAAE